MSFTFTYIDPNDVEVSMCVPERSIDEMCDYFQRFLSACGYIFDEGEHIKPVKNTNNTLAFDCRAIQSISPDDYFFGGADHVAFTGGGIRGGMAPDIISFG